MFSFEGDFRRKPIQSLGGASNKHQQRDLLLQRAQIERQRREEIRRQIQSAIVIQSFYRGYRARSYQKCLQRECFETKHRAIIQNWSLKEILTLMNSLKFFFNPDKDSNNLVWLSQLVIKNASIIRKECEVDRPIQFSLAHFLNLTLNFITHSVTKSCSDNRDLLGSHWRILEIFLNANNWNQAGDTSKTDNILGTIFSVLDVSEYFRRLKLIVDVKIPPLVEASTKAPTPLSSCLFDFIIQPLTFATHTKNMEYRTAIISSFKKEFLAPALSDAMMNFILPSLQMHNSKIPLFSLLQIDENIVRNPWFLYNVLVISDGHPDLRNDEVLLLYIKFISHQTDCLQDKSIKDDDESEDEEEVTHSFKVAEQDIIRRCLEVLNSSTMVQFLVTVSLMPSMLPYICEIGHNLLLSDRLALHKYRLLYTLAFKPGFLRQLLSHINSEKKISLFGSSDTLLIQLLAKGVSLSPEEVQRVVPALDVFCSLFSHLLVTLDDSEFYNETGSVVGGMPFTISEMVELASLLRDVCLGLVELAYPEKSQSSLSFLLAKPRVAVEVDEGQTKRWMHLFKSTVNLTRQLHTRDTRRTFCPTSVWITGRVALPLEQVSFHRQHRPFRQNMPLVAKRQKEEDIPSTREIRTQAILKEVPFVFSFTDRVKMWQQWIRTEKEEHQRLAEFQRGPSIDLSIRRNYIYEDAFEKLALSQAPNLKLRMRLSITNAVGLDEAGIDGGGLFREFLSELLKTCFDPIRGFFLLTTDNLLYPNPGVASIVPDFTPHYFFIGRMLGKALLENLLVELPFAQFFLCKMLGHASGSLDVHHLASLDPVLYKNLLSIRHYDGDVADLGLDFTIMNNEFGETKVEELKPNGANILVTSSNRIEYIHLVADYKLNKQIRFQCNAFIKGLADVINLERLQTFSYKEVQVLISGAFTPIDLNDLMRNTIYGNGYAEDHLVIQMFWNVVETFDDTRRRQLLKFVTSCSRPPLTGFKDLVPKFSVYSGGGAAGNRLPTAATCMNLLKLPEYEDEDVMRERLIYAIEAGAGFELS